MAKQPSKDGKTPPKPRKTPVKTAPAAESNPVAARIDAVPPEVLTASQRPTPAENAAKTAEAPEISPEKPAETPQAKVTSRQTPEKPATAPPPPPAPAQAKRSGFFPLVLGGLLAGGLGYVVGTQGDFGRSATALDAQGRQIADLENRIGDLAQIDFSAIEAAQAEIAGSLEAVQTALDEQVGALGARLDALEALPAGDGTISDRAISAYEAEVEALRAQLQEMTGAAVTDLDAARAEAAAIAENAAAAARAAAGRAALARIDSALTDGAEFGPALNDLQDVLDGDVPQALVAVQGGVPTLASLQESFPDVARAALAAARDSGVAGDTASGLGAFLRNQFEVRSVAPREGDDADAVLSRAEAAVKAGRLPDAIAEITALPAEAAAPLSDWLAQAESRVAAMTAVDSLSTSLNDN